MYCARVYILVYFLGYILKILIRFCNGHCYVMHYGLVFSEESGIPLYILKILYMSKKFRLYW